MDYFMGVHFRQGDKVIHRTWGSGTVVEDSSPDSTLIEFDKETDYGTIVEVSSVCCKKIE